MYDRLLTLISQTENKQRKTLEHLSSQVSQYKKKLADQESQIQILTEKNNELRSRLDRYAKAKKRNGVVISATGSSEHDGENSGNESAATSSHLGAPNDEPDSKSMDSSRKQKKQWDKPFSPQPQQKQMLSNSKSGKSLAVFNEEEMNKQVQSFLVSRLKYLMDLKCKLEEVSSLETRANALMDDKRDMEKELLVIEQQQAQAEDALKRRIVELDSKIDTLLQQHAKLSKSGNFSHPDTQRRLEDLKFSIDSYEEHKSEFFDRLKQGSIRIIYF